MYVDAAALASGTSVLVLLLHVHIHTCAIYIYTSSGLILVYVADHADLEPHRPQGGGVTLCPHTTIFVSSQYYTCAHTTICVLILCGVYVRDLSDAWGIEPHGPHVCILLYVSSVYLSTVCVLILGYVSSYYYMCVLTLLPHMCPHTPVCVSSHYCTCPHYYISNGLILPYI